jgi:hypothetical protein
MAEDAAESGKSNDSPLLSALATNTTTLYDGFAGSEALLVKGGSGL